MITILMPTYKRNLFLEDKTHPTLLLTKLDIVKKLIIIWHNVGEEVPLSIMNNLEKLKINHKVSFVYPEKNSLNNRFFPYDDISTECILSVDDDYLITKNALLKCYKYWKDHKNCLIGVVPRLMNLPNFYSGNAANNNNIPFNLILTGGAMFKKNFLYKYQDDADTLLLIDKTMNGEDIAFNFIYHSENKESSLVYVHDKNVKTWKKIKNNSISDSKNHLLKRFIVYNEMLKKYGDILPTSNKKIFLD